MTSLLEIKENLKSIYARFDIYILSGFKFLFSLLTLMLINGRIGFMYKLQNPALVLIAALLCSFLPVNVMVVICAAFALLNIYSLSLECAAVVMAVMVLMFLMYFRFTPKDSLVVLLLPVCHILKIPYIIPVCCGLIATPVSVVSCGCGTIIYYILEYVKDNSSVLGNIEADSTVSKFQYIVDNILSNREMVLMAAAFAVTVIVVYIIRRLPIENAWTIAIVTGIVVCDVIVLVGDIALGTEVSIIGVVIGSLVSLFLAIGVQFFVFSVDYTRTEQLQFEDDEYYYYVKAVPKMSVAAPEKKVKRIQAADRDSVSSTRRGPSEEKARAVVNSASRRNTYSSGEAVRTDRSSQGSRSSYSAGGSYRDGYPSSASSRNTNAGSRGTYPSSTQRNNASQGLRSSYGSSDRSFSVDRGRENDRYPSSRDRNTRSVNSSSESASTRRIPMSDRNRY